MFKNPWFIGISTGLIVFIFIGIFRPLKHVLFDSRKKKQMIDNLIKEANKLLDDLGEFELAMKKFDEISEKFDTHEFPEFYGIIQRGKALCYLNLSKVEEDEKFLNLAITYFQNALRIFEEKKQILYEGSISNEYVYPFQLAITKTNMAIAYAGLSGIRNKRENLQKAISLCNDTIEIYKLFGTPYQYAHANNNLGTYYARMAEIDEREKNLDVAINCFEEALTFYDIDKHRSNYLATLINVAGFYIYLSKVSNKKQSILKALEKYNRASEQFDIEKDEPALYSQIKNGLGNSYVELARFENREENISKALNTFERALEYIDKSNILDNFKIKFNMGIAFQELAKSKDGKRNLEKAISLYQESLKQRHIKDYPLDNANIQIQLGAAFGELAGLEEEFQEKKNKYLIAIQSFQHAQKIYTQEKYPLKYIFLCNNLATFYNNLSTISDKQNNLQTSIEYSNKVLSISNTEYSKFEYAKAILNLGNANANLANYREAERYFIEVMELLEDENTSDYKSAKEALDKIKAFLGNLK